MEVFDKSGNLGIGTTSPDEKLEIQGWKARIQIDDTRLSRLHQSVRDKIHTCE